MGVSLDKVEREAPHMVSLVKQAGVTLEKKGLNPDTYKSAVIATLDHSGSAAGLYDQGLMQEAADIAFAAGLLFDDDGAVPLSLFDNGVNPLGDMTLQNCKNFVAQHQNYRFGGTSYEAALRWIVDEAGFGNVNLDDGASGGGLFSRSKGSGGGLSVKAAAAYPTYAIFVTDGEPQDPRQAEVYLRQMSQLPIFVQFIGVGPHRFDFLRQLDDMDGRFIDNANFFDAKDAGNDQGKMLELMLSEFPDFYVEARRKGLIAQGAPVPG